MLLVTHQALISRNQGLRRRHAFTLLEVLVVVAILVVLASVASIYVFRSYEDAKKDAARNNAITIEKACKLFNLKYGQFPNQLTDLIQPPALDGGQPAPFLENGVQALKDPWGQMYQYQQPQASQSGQGEAKPVISTTAPDGTAITNMPHQQHP